MSVIVPTYNRADLIPYTIDSVLSQTTSDWELIVVDDGSTDDTAAVVKRYQDQDARVHYVRQENAGVSAARNRGVANSTGEYLCFLDSDDELLPQKVAQQAGYLDSHQSIGLVASGHLLIDREGQPLAQALPWRSYPRLDLATLASTCPMVPHAVLLRRSWFVRVGGFATSLSGAADHDLWLRLAYAGCTMEWTPEILCRYRLHGSNMIGDASKQERDHLVRLNHFYSQADLPPEVQEGRARAYGLAYLAGAARKYGIGQSQAASQSLEKAIALLPDLMEGEYPFLASALVAWAVNPVTGDPATFMARVLDNLPDSASRLRPLRQRMVCEAAIRSAVDATAVGNDALARQYLLSALEKERALSNDPALVVELLVNHIRGQEEKQQTDCVGRFFNNLPPELASLRAFRRKALGRLYMAAGFEAHKTGAAREAARAIWHGVRLDPTWLRNRGVRSILLRSMLTMAARH
ncbi:MAG: glycosyltransferase [Anaerolineae bacterium]|nr:glycosyltransferase [Anaerolineae bacterium]